MNSLPLRIAIFAFPFFAAFGTQAAEVFAVASGNWSDPATWGGSLPGAGADVRIPAGLTVTLDADVECGGIIVAGVLEVERADRSLLCNHLLVQGEGSMFRVGAPGDRFLQNFTLTLKGLPSNPAPVMGARVLGVHNGGTITMHGRDRVEWTHLETTAPAGATSLTLVEPVDWEPGESILVTPSGLNWGEAETRTITGVSADLRTVFFTPALEYLHSGNSITKTRDADGKSWTVNLRAEVGLLSRNVKIQGDADSETNGFGAHIMVMDGGEECCATAGRAYIQGVELYRMGQKSLIGRYPMHWHMVAEAGAGQYFKDNVVHRSFNRAITIHGTESTLVENNFCYDHLGHGLFLEDGSERFNIIQRNVVLGSRKPAQGEELLDTDNQFDNIQNRSPSSYWITNPNNTFIDNVAAGTEGVGFWFAFPQRPLNLSRNHPRFVDLEPYKEPLGVFQGNTAHSCALGLDINDQLSSNDTLVINGEWANDGPFYFDDLTWYANGTAIYAGIGGRRKNVVYRNNVFSDNETNLFLATYHLCEESLMVADSGFGLVPPDRMRTVYAVYDGAGRMKDNHLVGYDATNARFLQNIGAAIKHPNHYFEGLTFDPPSPVRSVLPNYNIIPPANVGENSPAHPRMWASVIVDVDGSISGVPNSSIISNHPFMMVGGETRPLEWTNTYRSDNRFAQVRLTYGVALSATPNVSVVRTKPGTPMQGVYYINGYKEWHQLPVIVRDDFLYTYAYEALPSVRRVDLNFDDAEVGDYCLIRLKHFGQLPGLVVNGMTAQPSLAALKSSVGSGYFVEAGGDLYVRPVATTTLSTHRITWSANIIMPVVDSDEDGISDGDEAAAGTDPFRAVDGTEPYASTEFHIAGNFENWVDFRNLANETVSGGVLAAQSVNTNSSMIERNLRINGSEVAYMLVRIRASKNANARFFWGTLNAPSYAESRARTLLYSGNNSWRVLAFPLHDHAEWQNQIITSMRLDPTKASATTFEIDWIRASDGNVVSTVPAKTTPRNTPTSPLPFTLSDDIGTDPTYVVTASSSNPALVPNANIALSGTGANRSVTVTPAPDGVGTATITLTVTNGTLVSSSSFDITVLTAKQSWRQLHFGTTENTGPAADTFDASGDGEINLLEFATAQNPHTATLVETELTQDGDLLGFTYSRSVAALADGLVVSAEWSDTLDPNSWSAVGMTEENLSEDGEVELIKVTLPAGENGKRFVRLRVSQP